MMRKEGKILFNGHPPVKRLKRQIGYVMQVCRMQNRTLFLFYLGDDVGAIKTLPGIALTL
jgi:hypothetical protein